MGIKLFSPLPASEPFGDRNPDPRNFNILRLMTGGDKAALLVEYPDATNYEGKKILVVKTDCLGTGKLDPHFNEDGIVLARFRPTDEGWEDAVSYLSSTDN